MDELRGMPQLQALVIKGFDDWEKYGNVRAVCKDNLVLFNYTHAAQYEGRWNWFERVSRGLILSRNTGEIVARPFDKFWNWGEQDRTSSAPIATVTEKLDGSLGILYRDEALPSIARYRVATRGAFDSDQALWATEHLNSYYDLCRCPPEYTLLFEIIYPENRIVVDYGDDQDLFLLAMRDRYDGSYLPWKEVQEWASFFGFPTPRVYDFDSVEDIIAAAKALDASEEGWVIEFADGQRFKVKGDRYFEVHRIVSGTSFRRAVEEIANGTFDDLVASVPDELLGQLNEWRNQVDATIQEMSNAVERVYDSAPQGSRKEFALYVNKRYPQLAPYLFARLDGRDYKSLMLRREF